MRSAYVKADRLVGEVSLEEWVFHFEGQRKLSAVETRCVVYHLSLRHQSDMLDQHFTMAELREGFMKSKEGNVPGADRMSLNFISTLLMYLGKTAGVIYCNT